MSVTVGFETNIKENFDRKAQRYEQLLIIIIIIIIIIIVIIILSLLFCTKKLIFEAIFTILNYRQTIYTIKIYLNI